MAKEQTKTFIIGPMVKEARLKLDISQVELAKNLGYGYGNFIGMIEGGTAKFPRENVVRFAKELNIPVHKFIKAWLKEYQSDWLPYLSFNKK